MRITEHTLGLLLESYVKHAGTREDMDRTVGERVRARTRCTAIAAYLWEVISEGNEGPEDDAPGEPWKDARYDV